jgi:hypothetical protein
MTLEMLPALGQRVTTGMPSMRIAVAGAQLREMLAVLFDKDPLLHPISGTARDRYKSLVTHTPQAAAPRPVGPPVPPGPAKRGLFRRLRGRR